VSKRYDRADFSYIDQVTASGTTTNSVPLGSLSPLDSSFPFIDTSDLMLDVDDGVETKNPLDRILSRHLLYRIIDVFLTYLYPLYPLPHRPTFLKDLIEQREERSGEEEWAIMVLGIVGYTVVQVPCQLMGMSKIEARDLVERCSQTVGGYLHLEYEDISPTWTRCELF
jgi:hypothetical protein